MLSFLDTRAARLTLSLGIVGTLGWILSDRVLHRTSIDAVVNAPRIDIVAPIEGVVATLPAQPGQALLPGAEVAAIRRASWSQGGGDELGTRVERLRTRVAALLHERGTLTALRDTLGRRVAAHRGSTVAQLAATAGERQAVAAERQAQLERVRALAAAGGATSAELDRLRAEAATAAAQARAAGEAHRAAVSGVVTNQGAQDVPYSAQRADEVTLRLAALDVELATAAAELRALEGQVPDVAPVRAGEATPGDALLRVASTVGGVVWSAPYAPGSLVMKGAVLATLVDCSRVFLEARVTPRDHEHIRPGSPVRFRFAGSSRDVRGTVAYVRGGAVKDDGSAAAQLVTGERGIADGRAVIAVDGQDIGATPRNFCQVGRSAKVVFEDAGAGAAELAPRGKTVALAREAPIAPAR